MTRTLTRAAVSLTLAIAAAAAAAPAAPASAATGYSVTRIADPASGHGTVVRWNPCTRTSTGFRTHYITYRVNPAGDRGRVALVEQAVAKLAAASGLHFRYVGETTYVPHNAVVHYLTGDRTMFEAAQERRATGAELVIAWAPGSRSNLLTRTEAGVGTASWSASRTSQLRVVEAAVVMKTGVSLKPGFAAGASVGALLLHELGHAVGLEHVTSKSQIMYPVIGSWSRAGYHTGDRAGLRLVGGSAGCMRSPADALADPAAMARAAGVPVTL